MHFLGSLGIDWKLFLAQMVNFGLLVFLLTKFFYRPILEKIERDEKTLQEAETKSKTLEKEKQAFAEEKKREIQEARKQAKEIIQEAENIAHELEERTRKEASAEREAVIAQIRSRLDDIDHANTQKK